MNYVSLLQADQMDLSCAVRRQRMKAECGSQQSPGGLAKLNPVRFGFWYFAIGKAYMGLFKFPIQTLRKGIRS